MTRDSQRLVEEQDGDGDLFSALWTAAPSFPQLPPDAPQGLKALTVDVEDPKKIYSIYRASRRHGFQILVERFAPLHLLCYIMIDLNSADISINYVMAVKIRAATRQHALLAAED
jgi:hypothetical protein